MSAADESCPLVYIHCDVPEGMTLAAWRAERATRGAAVTRMGSVLRRLRRVRRARRR